MDERVGDQTGPGGAFLDLGRSRDSSLPMSRTTIRQIRLTSTNANRAISSSNSTCTENPNGVLSPTTEPTGPKFYTLDMLRDVGWTVLHIPWNVVALPHCASVRRHQRIVLQI